MGMATIGNKQTLFVTLMPVPSDSKRCQASFLLISTDWLHLQVAQTPRFRDLAIFVVTTDRQTDRQTDCIAPANAHGVIWHVCA